MHTVRDGDKTTVVACLPKASCHSPSMDKARVLRDIKARNGVKAYEVVRRAYLYVARNQSLPPQVRHQAQLQLNTFGRYTRPTTVKNRCTETGRGRGIMSEFGLCRVCVFIQSYQPAMKFTTVTVSISSESP